MQNTWGSKPSVSQVIPNIPSDQPLGDGKSYRVHQPNFSITRWFSVDLTIIPNPTQADFDRQVSNWMSEFLIKQRNDLLEQTSNKVAPIYQEANYTIDWGIMMPNGDWEATVAGSYDIYFTDHAEILVSLIIGIIIASAFAYAISTIAHSIDQVILQAGPIGGTIAIAGVVFIIVILILVVLGGSAIFKGKKRSFRIGKG